MAAAGILIPKAEFPYEQSRSIEVREHLAREFEFAHRILRFWLDTPKDPWLRKASLPPDVLHLAMALHTQACRQMRSIIQECERCEAFCANITARSLFESVLAVCFILKPKVHITLVPVLDGKGQQKKAADGSLKYSARPPGKKHPTTRKNLLLHQLRADLYVANTVFSQQSRYRKCMAVHGLKGLGRFLAGKIDHADIARCEKEVGPEWSYVLRQSNGYSGLSVADLSKLLHRKLFHWYTAIYGVQSGMSHGAEALMHLKEIDDKTIGSAFVSTDSEIASVLQCATTLFSIFVEFMQTEIGFGNAVATALWSFQRESHNIYRVDAKK